MPYVDGFIVPVPKKSVQVYRRMAKKAGKIWREHGALEFCECVDGDVKVGKLASAQRQAQAERDGDVLLDRVQIAGRS